ncbi:MAG: tRNA pseudouridine32 synthase/23S rRNA pseudouridine746 synthase [Granulosicoccus sp.]|jgi:tRNA pseudouridine32 synthase/23S rRNA pseudouridine746 synthase
MYSIVAENEHFIVVNKHVGVCVHSEPDEVGLLVQMKQDLQLEQLLPVHRLDKVTSGLLLCAKTSAAASELSQLFQNRQVEKYYLALSDKKPKKKQGLISGGMERGRRGSWKLSQSKDNPAITQFFSYGLGDGNRLFLLKPKTGKTHQLRVALKSIGSPISGDRLYGHPLSLPKGIRLHASILSFEYQGEYYRYVDFPQDWLPDKRLIEDSLPGDALAAIQQPWLLSWPVLR